MLSRSEGIKKGRAQYGTELKNAGVPEHGTIKDVKGNTVMTFFSPEHLVKWMAANGFGDIGDLEAKGYKFSPVLENAEFKNSKELGSKRGASAYGSRKNTLYKIYCHGDVLAAIEAPTPEEALIKCWEGDQVRDYLKGHPETKFSDLKVKGR